MDCGCGGCVCALHVWVREGSVGAPIAGQRV